VRITLAEGEMTQKTSYELPSLRQFLPEGFWHEQGIKQWSSVLNVEAQEIGKIPSQPKPGC
jgi:hypothetical protein